MMNGDEYLLTCVNLFGTGINEFDEQTRKGKKKKNRKGILVKKKKDVLRT